MKIIGILGLQGAIVEHEQTVLKAAIKLNMNIDIKRIVLPEDLERVDGIILPGGESTAMILIGSKTGMLDAVMDQLSKGLPAFGTCAGAILLSKKVRRNLNSSESEGAFPFLDMEILRNGYGRQINSFTTDLQLLNDEIRFNGIFIRAPMINTVSDNIEILISLKDKPVLVKQGNILASTFHPELTDDTRIHEIFLKLV